MDQNFKQNQLKPGDQGYEYEIEKEFEPALESNEWDEETDDYGF